MLETLSDIFYAVPTDAMVGVWIEEFKMWYAERVVCGSAIFSLVGWIVYKTPWTWDNKLFEMFKNKLGFKTGGIKDEDLKINVRADRKYTD